MIVKVDITILVILCACTRDMKSELPIIENIGERNKGHPSFVCKIPVGNF